MLFFKVVAIDIIENKSTTNRSPREAKQERDKEFEKIALQFENRSQEQIKKLYENIRCKVIKIDRENAFELKKTEGGVPNLKNSNPMRKNCFQCSKELNQSREFMIPQVKQSQIQVSGHQKLFTIPLNAKKLNIVQSRSILSLIESILSRCSV